MEIHTVIKLHIVFLQLNYSVKPRPVSAGWDRGKQAVF